MNRVRKKVSFSHILWGIFALMLTCIVITKNYELNAATTYPYLIKVNKQQNVITVYEKDKKGNYTVPVKAMVCSTGVATPTGTFKTPVRYRWKLLDGDVWGQYSTRIVKGILFHSVWYYEQDPSTLSAKQYNKLGIAASHGCVRVTVADAKWIYDNCPIGTTVTIYNSKNPGPLGKPEAIKIKEGTGWDPTDILNKDNPYNNKKPSILGTKNQTVDYGTKVDLKKGISALSSTGLYITSDIKVSGKVNTYKPGMYKVTYSITDLLERKATKTVTYKVNANNAIPVITGVANRTVSKDVVINRAFALKGVKVSAGKQALDANDIKTVITKNKDNTYTIDYSVVAANGESATAKSIITVDITPPEIIGVKDKEIAWDTVVDEQFALEGIKVKDDTSKLKKDDILVTIYQYEDDTFTVDYEATDDYGNKTKVSAIYTITDFLMMKGVSDKIISSLDIVNEYFVKQGVMAMDKDIDVTWKLTVTISELKDNSYTVTYQVKDDFGHEETAVAVFTIAQ